MFFFTALGHGGFGRSVCGGGTWDGGRAGSVYLLLLETQELGRCCTLQWCGQYGNLGTKCYSETKK